LIQVGFEVLKNRLKWKWEVRLEPGQGFMAQDQIESEESDWNKVKLTEVEVVLTKLEVIYQVKWHWFQDKCHCEIFGYLFKLTWRRKLQWSWRRFTEEVTMKLKKVVVIFIDPARSQWEEWLLVLIDWFSLIPFDLNDVLHDKTRVRRDGLFLDKKLIKFEFDHVQTLNVGCKPLAFPHKRVLPFYQNGFSLAHILLTGSSFGVIQPLASAESRGLTKVVCWSVTRMSIRDIHARDRCWSAWFTELNKLERPS
jgi:hypothetical protein